MIVLDLPFPVSVNALYCNKAGKGRVKSQRYREWSNVAGWQLKAQKPGKITGRYALTILLEQKDGRRRDIGNLEKSVSDLLVEHGVVEDDALAASIFLAWADVNGCQVIVRQADFVNLGTAARNVVSSLEARQ
jgi:crossover junction endodeoxyribonuclease RusA